MTTTDQFIAALKANEQSDLWIKMLAPVGYWFVPASSLLAAMTGQGDGNGGQEGQPPAWPPDPNEPFAMYLKAGNFVNVRKGTTPASALVKQIGPATSTTKLVALNYQAKFDAPSTHTYAPLADGSGYVALDLLYGYDPALPFPPLPDSAMIGTPYDSQWQMGANKYINDCGPACVAMLLRWQQQTFDLSGPLPTIDQLADQTTLATAPGGLPTSALPTLAAKYGLPLIEVTGSLTLDRVRQEIAAGRPVIVLITYAYIPERMDSDGLGHFCVVRGYDATGFYINDPDFWSQGSHRLTDGDKLFVTAAHLDAAMKNAPIPNQGCVVNLVVPPTPVTPPPVVIPPAPTFTEAAMYVNTPNDVLIVHKSPDHDPANYLKDPLRNNDDVTLPDQKQVKVLVPVSGSFEFVQIAADNEPLAGAWLAYSYLSPALRPVQPTPPPVPGTGIVKVASPQDLVGLHTEARGHWVPGFFKSAYPKRHIKATVLRGTEDDGCTVDDLIAIDPNALTIERWYWDDNNFNVQLPDMRINQDNIQAGRSFFAAYAARFNPSHKATYIQAYNEPPYGVGFASWAVGQILQAHSMGFRVVVGSFSTQNPTQEFLQLPQTADMIRAIKQYDGILGLHRYTVPDPSGPWASGPMADVDDILSWLPADCRDVPIWFNEYGVGAGSTMSSDQYVAGVTSGLTYLWNRNANIRAVSLWAAGDWWKEPNQKGPNSNIYIHTGRLLQWLIA